MNKRTINKGHHCFNLFFEGKFMKISFSLLILVLLLYFNSGSLFAQGKWLHDEDGKPVGRLELSGLTYFEKSLWSIGDQSSTLIPSGAPGYLFCIDPNTASLKEPPILIDVPESLALEYPFLKLQLDFEALTIVPNKPGEFIAVTEETGMRMIRIKVDCNQNSGIHTHTASVYGEPIQIQKFSDVRPWNNDNNYRIEGCVSDVNGNLYIAYERTDDELPRVFKLSIDHPEINRPILGHKQLLKYKKEAEDLLNFNGLSLVSLEDGSQYLFVLARDQQKLFVFDIQKNKIAGIYPLNLQAPSEVQPKNFSPEGIATHGNKVWIINDPWDARYQIDNKKGDVINEEFYKMLNPILFEWDINRFLSYATTMGLPLRGSGMRKYSWFIKICKVFLYVNDPNITYHDLLTGKYSSILSLRYVIDISENKYRPKWKKRLIDDFKVEKDKVDDFLKCLPAFVRKGDVLDLQWLSNNVLNVYRNKELLGEIKDTLLIQAVYNSLLGPDAPKGVPEGIFGKRPSRTSKD